MNLRLQTGQGACCLIGSLATLEHHEKDKSAHSTFERAWRPVLRLLNIKSRTPMGTGLTRPVNQVPKLDMRV